MGVTVISKVLFEMVASGSYSVVSPCLWVTAPWLVFSLLPFVYLPQTPLRTVCTGYNANEEDKSHQHWTHPRARAWWGWLLSSLCRLSHGAGGIQWAGCSITANDQFRTDSPHGTENWLQDSLNTTYSSLQLFLPNPPALPVGGGGFTKARPRIQFQLLLCLKWTSS